MDQTDETTDGHTIILSSSDRDLVETCSLVLSATDISHRISSDPGGTIHIAVPREFAERAAYQLDAFFRENEDWPPLPAEPEKHDRTTSPPTVLLIGALALFYSVTGPWSRTSAWFENGAGDADAILQQGEWHRLITALTLHADLSHLLGNCLIGGFLLHFFLQIHGTGIGLMALLVSAALGNLINVQVHGGDHLFVGFSTAVFATIGMLSSHQIIEQRTPFGLRMIVPFMAGAALLAMLGSSGVRTDLGAHLFGLIAGLLVGLALEHPTIKRARDRELLQGGLVCGALIVVMWAWNIALSG